jgi:translocation and assembly module TamB
MTLSPLERSRALADGNLNLIKNDQRFVLEGDFSIDRLLWRRELDEEFAFSSLSYPETDREPGFFDDMTLNIHLHADDNAWLENSLGQIQAKMDLTLAGNVFNPVVLGDIEAIEGTVFFQDREFNVIQGRVSFFNPARIEPYLNFKGETYVKDYHVNFSLEGLLEKLNPEFSSSPPLPPEDVLALLALGEAFRRTYHYDRSIGQSTASLLSFQLSEEAKKRAEQLFSIDRFRIDPFIMGSSSEMTARLTLGKKLSRNFFILYSTNLASQREEITRIEWELSNDFSIVGTRDETGRVSFDVKIHKRF